MHYNLPEIDEWLRQYSYICGYEPSCSDIDLFNGLGINIDFQKYKYIKRWWYHMRSFNDSEVSLFPKLDPPKVMQKVKDETLLDQQVCDVYSCSFFAFVNTLLSF